MRKPTILVGLGSGREGWLSVELDSLRFVLEIEDGNRTVEDLSLAELKTRLPGISGLVAEIVAEAIRARPAGQG
jgi:hypothetical protein